MGRRIASWVQRVTDRAPWRRVAIVVAILAVALVAIVGVSGSWDDQRSPWYMEAPTQEGDAYVLRLSPSQREKCVSAYYTIVGSWFPDDVGYFSLMDGIPVEVDDDGRIAIPLDPSILEVVSDTGFDSMVCGMGWERSEGEVDYYATDNFRLNASTISMGYAYGAGFEEAVLEAAVNRRTGQVDTSIRRIEATYPLGETVTPEQLASYRAVQYLWHKSKGKTRAEDGTLAPISEWEDTSVIWSDTCSYSNAPSFSTRPVSGMDRDCFLQVVVRDAEGGLHGSELVKIHSGSENADERTKQVQVGMGTLTFELEDDHAELVSYTGEDEVVRVPAEVVGKPVTVCRGGSIYSEKKVREVVLPSTIRAIGTEAIKATRIERLVVPSGLLYLGDGAFYETRGLVKFVQETDNGLTSVRDGVLYSADGKTLLAYPSAKGAEYEVPEGVTAIGVGAFAGSRIERVTLPTSLRSIGACAFLNCNRLEQPTLPSNLEYLGASAFSVSLTSESDEVATRNRVWRTVELGPQVCYVGDQAFHNRELQAYVVDSRNVWYHDANGFLVGTDGTLVLAPDALTGALVIPEGVKTLASGALRDYKSKNAGNVVQWVDLFLPRSLQNVEEDALPETGSSDDMGNYNSQKTGAVFHVPQGSWAESYAKQNHISYDNATSPRDLTWRSVEITQHKAKLTFRRYASHAVLVGIEANYAGHIVIPDSVEGVPVTTIGADADDVAKGVVKTVVIPASVVSITEGALLTKLTNVRKYEVDSKNTHYVVREGSLCTADGKTLVAYPGGRGESYAVPDGIAVIGARAFSNAKVQSVVLPEGIERIEGGAFSNCADLERINFPSSLQSVGREACEGVKKIKPLLNEGVVDVGTGAFGNVEAYDSLDLPNSVERVGGNAFSSAYKDERMPVASRVVRIGSGLKELGDNPFAGLDFDTFEVSPDNECFRAQGPFLLSKDGRVLYAIACTAGPVVRVPDGVEAIEPNVFRSPTQLTDVYLPESVLRLGYLGLSSEQKESVTMHCSAGSEAELIAQSEELKLEVS